MQKQAPTLGKILVMVGFALSCFGLLLFLWLTFGGAIPFAAKGYRVTVPLKEASQLAEEADVRISGVPVGKVKAIELAQNGKTTDAVIELDERYAPLPKDAKATTRAKTLLGETYIELTPGTPRKDNMLPEGGRLAPASISPSVELDEILRAFDPRTRRDFQAWMQGLSMSVNGRGQDISNALGTLAPTAEDATDLIEVLNQQQTAVSRLVSNTGVVFNALGERDGELRSLIENSNRLFATTASRDRQLREIFQVLPTFQRESRTTLQRLDAFTRNADPVVTQLRPAVRELSPTLRSVQTLAPDLRGLFEDLGPLIEASRRGLPATTEFLRLARPVFAQLDPFLRNLNPQLQGLAYYKRELRAFFANSVGATQAAEPVPGDPSTKVHYLRTGNPLSPEGLAPYPRRIGSNRPNPYQSAGAFSRLEEGLQVFEDRQCGRPTPRLLTSIVPELLTATTANIADIVSSANIPGIGPLARLLPPNLRPVQLVNAIPAPVLDLVQKIVFPNGRSPAPGCNKQPPLPDFGRVPGSARGSDYQQLYPDPVPDLDSPTTPTASTASAGRGR